MREASVWIALASLVASALLLVGCPPSNPPTMLPPPTGGPPAPPPAEPPAFPTTATNGDVALAPGFAPQPFVLVGDVVGNTPATTFNAPCPLFIGGPPSNILTVSGGFQQLAVLSHSRDAGVGLMIMAEQGGFLCSDPGDTAVRGQFPPGRYAIWVGTTGEGAQAFYRLGFSEQADVSADSLEASLMGAWDATGDAVTLAPGFDPDPHTVQGTVRGVNAAADLDASCAGFIPVQPSHLLSLSGDFPALKIMVRHTRDTALVVTDGVGNIWCGDDEEQRFPVIGGEFGAGRYRIFVATKVQNGSAGYTLGFSASGDTTVRSLPRAPTPE